MDRQTLDFYEREAPRYTQHFGQRYSRFLDSFLDRLEPGAQVLELGCGGGRDLQQMLTRGFAVDATDGTAAMVAKATERTGHPARQMRFDELEAVGAYDAVWAHASLLHETTADLPDVFARIYRALRPGGWFFANYKLGEGEGRDSFGRFYNFPRRETLLSIYRALDWVIEPSVDYRDGGLDKVLRDWTAFTVRKPTALS